ncbi:MAG: hypothetical protein WC511_01575 [Candidatus Pacearchaeota archaeon]
MKKENNIRIRINAEEKEILENKAKEFGFDSLSNYLRFVGKNCKIIKVEINEP